MPTTHPRATREKTVEKPALTSRQAIRSPQPASTSKPKTQAYLRGPLPSETLDLRGEISRLSSLRRLLVLDTHAQPQPPSKRRIADLRKLRLALSAALDVVADVAPAPLSKAPLSLDSTENLVRAGHLVSTEEFQALMGWASRQAVSKALKDHRVFSLDIGTKSYFPAFLADDTYGRKQLATVSKALGDLPGGAKLQFFITRKGSLGGKTTLEALAAGKIDMVLNNAAAFAEV